MASRLTKKQEDIVTKSDAKSAQLLGRIACQVGLDRSEALIAFRRGGMWYAPAVDGQEWFGCSWGLWRKDEGKDWVRQPNVFFDPPSDLRATT